MPNMTIEGICTGLFTTSFAVSTTVDNTTGEGDWRYFGHLAKLCLKQQTARQSLDLFIQGALVIQTEEDTGQWIDHIQNSCKLVNDPSMPDGEVLSGVLKGFTDLDAGAHNTDQWSVLKYFSQSLAGFTPLAAVVPLETESIFTLNSAAASLMAYIDFVAGGAAAGDQTGSGDWRAFQACAQAGLSQGGSADSALAAFIDGVARLDPNEDNGQWDHIQSACIAVNNPSSTTRQKFNGVVAGLVALDEGAHNLDQWAALKGYASPLRQLHFNAYVPNDRNIEMNDVESAFGQLSAIYSRCYYSIDRGPVAVVADLTSHFKGISAFGGKLIFTHTNVGTDGGVGKRIVAYEPIFFQDINADNPQDTSPPELQHPCSSQACGRYMAMGIQTSESDLAESQIQIQDLNGIPLGGPIVDIASIPRPNGINGVGLTKEHGPDGKYILAGIQGNTLQIYTSADANMVDEASQKLTTFTQAYKTDSFVESGCGLALVTQTDGNVYLVTMDGDPGNFNHVSLYELTRDSDKKINGVSPQLQQIDLSHFSDFSKPIEELEAVAYLIPGGAVLVGIGDKYLETSFRYGKGLEVTSPDSFQVFGSDRNSIPLSQISRGSWLGWTKDWSVCVWQSDALAS